MYGVQRLLLWLLLFVLKFSQVKALHTNITDLQNLTTFERARIDKILGDNRKAFNDVLGMSQLPLIFTSWTHSCFWEFWIIIGIFCLWRVQKESQHWCRYFCSTLCTTSLVLIALTGFRFLIQLRHKSWYFGWFEVTLEFIQCVWEQAVELSNMSPH